MTSTSAQTVSDLLRELGRVNGIEVPPHVTFLPATAAHCRGDIASTIRELDALTQSFPTLKGPPHTSVRRAFIRDWNLGLGRPGAAAIVIALVEQQGGNGWRDIRDFMLAQSAYFADDRAALRDHLSDVRLD